MKIQNITAYRLNIANFTDREQLASPADRQQNQVLIDLQFKNLTSIINQ